MGKIVIPRRFCFATFIECLIGTLNTKSAQQALSRYTDVYNGNLPNPGSKGIVFAACDDKYYWLFARSLAASLAVNSPQYALHLHICGPSEKTLSDFDRLRDALKALTLTVSWEPIDLSPYSGPAFQYFASVRFLRLAQILQAAKAPVLVIDADSVIKKDLTPLFQNTAKDDFGLFLRPRTVPWRKILATVVIAYPTAAGFRFFERVGRGLARIFEWRPGFHVDQLAIWYVYLLTFLTSRPGIRRLKWDTSDWNIERDSFIWSAKGPRKFQEEGFLQELQRHLPPILAD